MLPPRPCYSRVPLLCAILGGLMLLAGCAAPFGAVQRDFQPLPPDTLEQSTTVLLKLDSHQGDIRHHWEAVLNVDADRIDLIILGPLGQRLATLRFNDQQLMVERGGPLPFDSSIEKLLGELQMIFWPLAVLNADEWNQDWHFSEQKNIRYVYYQQQRVAEIHRRSTSAWSGDFDYISRISDYRLNIRSSELDRP